MRDSSGHPSTRTTAARLGVGLLAAALLAAGAALATPPGSAHPATSGPADGSRLSLVRVAAPTAAARTALVDAGFDVTAHVVDGGVDVVADAADLARLRADHRVRMLIPDLMAHDRAERAAEAAEATEATEAGRAGPSLPSGRTRYRNLADYTSEMTDLARRYPAYTRLVRLPEKTVQGRTITALEIGRDIDTEAGDRPTALLWGDEHAREWPTGEMVMEFAYTLLQGRDSTRIAKLLASTRVLLVPVLNVDGFAVSRGNSDYAYKRKNCTVSSETPEAYAVGPCNRNSAGPDRGTDVNRNYPELWGGQGADTVWYGETFRGDAPGDTEETQNIRWIYSTRHVTTSMDTHDYAGLTLRPPGVKGGVTPEAGLLKRVGDRINAPVGYDSVAAWQLYATTGTSMDWTYLDNGALSYSYELGLDEFHPRYSDVVKEYVGAPGTLSDGRGGVREGFLRVVESASDPTLHSRISGTKAPGTRLELSRVSQGSTSGGQTFTNTVRTRYSGPSGAFTWNVNPSTPPKARVSNPQAVQAWTLRCVRTTDATVLKTSKVRVERGKQVSVGTACRTR